MKARRRRLVFWTVFLCGLNAIACFRTLDVSKVRCGDNSNCPSGYSCSRTSNQAYGACVPGGPSADGSTGDLPFSTPVDGSSAQDKSASGGSGGSSGAFGDASTGSGGSTSADGPSGDGGNAETGTTPNDGPGADTADVPNTAGPETGTSTDTKDAQAGTDVVMTLSNGSTCTADTQCTYGHCVDGLCCDTKCDGQCESCNENGSVGTCKVRTGAPLTTRAACGGTGMCRGQCDGSNKACVPAGNSIVCTQASCLNGTATPAAHCDGSGTCPPVTGTPCASNLCASDGIQCATSCTATSCATGSYCGATGACATTKGLGSTCSSIAECTTGNCVGGVCCDSPCNGTCQACSSSGHCNVSPATDPNCPTVTSCPANTTCGSYTPPSAHTCRSYGACKNSADCVLSPVASRTSCAPGSLCDGQGNCTAQQMKCGSVTCDLSYQECCMDVGLSSYSCTALGNDTLCPPNNVGIIGSSYTVPTTCDMDTNCPSGQVCCLNSVDGGNSVECIAAADCVSQAFYERHFVCSSPETSTSCPSGQSCATLGDSIHPYLPGGWKVCQ